MERHRRWGWNCLALRMGMGWFYFEYVGIDFCVELGGRLSLVHVWNEHIYPSLTLTLQLTIFITTYRMRTPTIVVVNMLAHGIKHSVIVLRENKLSIIHTLWSLHF